jgi:site-specific recombinase XerD
MSKLSSHLRPFLEHVEVEKGRSHLTVRNYEFYLQRFIEWAKNPAPDEITMEMIHNYRLYLNRLESGSKLYQVNGRDATGGEILEEVELSLGNDK